MLGAERPQRRAAPGVAATTAGDPAACSSAIRRSTRSSRIGAAYASASSSWTSVVWRGGDPREHRVGIVVARLDAFEVEDRHAAEARQLTGKPHVRDRVHGRRRGSGSRSRRPQKSSRDVDLGGLDRLHAGRQGDVVEAVGGADGVDLGGATRSRHRRVELSPTRGSESRTSRRWAPPHAGLRPERPATCRAVYRRGRARWSAWTEIRAAAERMRGVVVRTLAAALRPARRWTTRHGHPRAWMKPESLQPIGAFKLRGAYNALASLTPTSGRAALSPTPAATTRRAWRARGGCSGIRVVVVMPRDAPRIKIERVLADGAEIDLVGPSGGRARRPGRTRWPKQGWSS